MLFNFRSRYYYAIGLKSYLELEISNSHIPTTDSGHGTQESKPQLPFTLYLRDYHPLWSSFPETLSFSEEVEVWSIHHISLSFREGFGLLFSVFSRPY